jgi:hypothetical protein
VNEAKTGHMRQMRAFPRKVTMDSYASRQLLSGRTQGIATRPDFYQVSHYEAAGSLMTVRAFVG